MMSWKASLLLSLLLQAVPVQSCSWPLFFSSKPGGCCCNNPAHVLIGSESRAMLLELPYCTGTNFSCIPQLWLQLLFSCIMLLHIYCTVCTTHLLPVKNMVYKNGVASTACVTAVSCMHVSFKFLYMSDWMD